MINLNDDILKSPVISLTKYVDLPPSQVWTVKYFTESSADKTPLLVVHGGPGIPHNYLLSLTQIAQYRPVIFYDQGGCGTSTIKKDPKWTMDFFFQELEDLCDALKLKHFHFLGHSWGGTMALEYAFHKKKNLKSLVLASPQISTPRFLQDAQHLLAAMPLSFQEGIRQHEKAKSFQDPAYADALKTYYAQHFCRLSPWPKELQYALDHKNQEIYNTLWGPSAFYPQGALASHDRFEDLHRIQIPTLITCGKYDSTTPETMRKCVEKLPRGELYVFENSAHLAHLEEEAAYAYKLEGFLRKYD